MSVYRRKSGRWAVRVDVDRDASGRRRRRALGTFATRKEAESAEREALFTKDRGVDLSPRHVTVAELLSRYLRDRASRCGAKTLQEYERIGNRYVLPRLGAMLLAKVRPAHIAEWQAAIAESGGRNDSAISPKTVYHARALLYGALRWAVKMQLLAANPCAAVDPPTIRRSEAKALRSDEIARLLDAAAPTRWGPFVALAFALGARRGELLALRWSNIDLERRTVTIEASLSQTRSGVSRKGTKTDRVRTVPLSPLALDAIRRQRALQAQDKLVAGAAYADQGFVFRRRASGARGFHPRALSEPYVKLSLHTAPII
jgi:integrase